MGRNNRVAKKISLGWTFIKIPPPFIDNFTAALVSLHITGQFA
jgi:hypothetical protein